MFGSFLPSLWSSCNQSVLGSRSRHCYAIKAIGLEPQIEPWLTRFNHASLSRFRIRERRHDNKMNLEKEKVLRSTRHGLESAANIFAPSSRRGDFSLDFLLYRTGLYRYRDPPTHYKRAPLLE